MLLENVNWNVYTITLNKDNNIIGVVPLFLISVWQV